MKFLEIRYKIKDVEEAAAETYINNNEKLNNSINNQNQLSFDEKGSSDSSQENHSNDIKKISSFNDEINDEYNFDNENKVDLFFTDEVNERVKFKEFRCSKKQNNDNEIGKSKKQNDYLPFNVDSFDTFQNKNYENTSIRQKQSVCSIMNNESMNKINIFNKSSKCKIDLENKNIDIASNSNIPVTESFFNPSINNINKIKLGKASSIEKSSENVNLLATLNNENYTNNNKIVSKKDILNSSNKNNKNGNHNNTDKNHYLTLVQQGGINNNYSNANSLNKENLLNNDIIMDRVTKHTCCSSINVNDKCLIF